MRIKLFGLAICCALVGAALAAVSFASASSQGGTTITIKTIQQAVAFTSIDADHNGKPSVGDYAIAQVVHLSPKSGKRIGGGTAICTQINAAGTLFDCQGEDHFAGGDIREAGRFRIPAKGFRIAIIGGTGVYQGAAGELNGTWLDAKLSKARDVFTIKRG